MGVSISSRSRTPSPQKRYLVHTGGAGLMALTPTVVRERQTSP